jgi:hypothetical protein
MSATGLRPSWQFATRPPAGIRIAEPILGIRALRYEADGMPGRLPAIAGLRVQAVGVAGACPEWDAQTGQFRFDDLPPGPRRILLTDPERRYLPAALNLVIPSRFPARPTMAEAPPQGPLPRRTVLLRPAPGRAVPPGMTAVIGTLRDASGRGIALGRIACASQAEGRALRIVTFTDHDGGFALLLPGDAAADAATVLRALAVHVPVPLLARALALDPLGALPAELDQHDPEGTTSLFLPRPVEPRDADGQPAGAPPGMLPVRPGRTIRWDLAAA